MARILIIDDNETMREGLGATVRRMGHEARAGGVGRRGVEADRGGAEHGRLRDHRSQDGGERRAGGLEGGRRARSRLPGDDRDGVRLRRDRRRGDADRRLRLHPEAVRARGGAPQGGAGAGAAGRAARARAGRGGERGAARRRRARVPLRRDRRRDAGDARAVPDDREGRADRRVGLHPRRVGDGEGAGRARDPRPVEAGERAVRQGELRRADRDAAGVGAVRSRAGGVHRRHQAKARAVRAGRQGDAVPRRDRRHHAGAAAQAAARAAGARVRAGRRRGDDQGRRARAVGDPPGHRRPRRPPGVSARISSTGCTSSPARCRRCASARRTSRAWRPTSSPSSRRARTPPSIRRAASPTRRWRGSASTPGPATSASWRT